MSVGYTLKRFRDYARAVLMLQKLNRHDRWTPQQLAEYQQRQLSTLVTYAIDHSPFYRELYRNVKPDRPIVLSNLPVINKATMMEHFDRLVTDSRLKLAELHAHLGQMTRDEYHLGQYRILTTAGSSGLKGVFVFNRNEWSAVLAAGFRPGSIMGMSVRLQNRWKLTMIGADGPTHVTQRMASSSDFGHVKMQHLRATSRIEDLVRDLNAFQPDAVYTYPSIASLLAIEQLEGRLRVHLKVVETGAEVRTNEMELNIRNAWGVTPFNVYGTTECGAGNVDCSFHRGIHLFEDLWIAEVVDEHNQPVPDGSPGHKVLATNLFNFTQPLIRYEVTDMLTLSTEVCPCGRPFRLIANVEGRSDDILHLQSLNGHDVPVHPIHVRDSLGALPEIKEYSVVHDDDRITATIVLRAGAAGEDITIKLTDNLRTRLESLGARCPEITVRCVDRIERDPSTMGKLKLVRSKASPKSLNN